jgi:hypothetical protein
LYNFAAIVADVVLLPEPSVESYLENMVSFGWGFHFGCYISKKKDLFEANMPIWHNFGRTLASRCNNCVRVRIM